MAVSRIQVKISSIQVSIAAESDHTNRSFMKSVSSEEMSLQATGAFQYEHIKNKKMKFNQNYILSFSESSELKKNIYCKNDGNLIPFSGHIFFLDSQSNMHIYYDRKSELPDKI